MAKITVKKKLLFTLVQKEFRQLFRDKRMLFMLFGSPIFMLLLFGYAVNTDVKDVQIAVFDQDRSLQSREFIRGFTASSYFSLYTYLESAGQMDRLMDRGQIDMFIHIKKGFSKRLRTAKNTEIQIIIDGTDSSRASVIVAYINLVTAGFSFKYFKNKVFLQLAGRGIKGISMKKTAELEERLFFNPNMVSKDFYLPGVLGLLIALITIMLTSMSVVKERESGTIEQIIVSPLLPIEFIAGKTAPFAIIALFDIFVITLVAILWFKVPFNGNFLFLLVSGLCYILSTLAVGLYISTVSGTQQQAMLSTFLFFIPSILLSGFVFPIYAMPKPVQYVTLLNPMRYFITIVRGIFLKGTGLAELWLQVVMLLLLGSVLFYFSVKRFARRME